MDGIAQCFLDLSERMQAEVIRYAQCIKPSVQNLTDLTPEIAETLLTTDYFGWGGSLAYCISDHGNSVRAALRCARDYDKVRLCQAKARRYEAASAFGHVIRGASSEDAREMVERLGEELAAQNTGRKPVNADDGDEFPF